MLNAALDRNMLGSCWKTSPQVSSPPLPIAFLCFCVFFVFVWPINKWIRRGKSYYAPSYIERPLWPMWRNVCQFLRLFLDRAILQKYSATCCNRKEEFTMIMTLQAISGWMNFEILNELSSYCDILLPLLWFSDSPAVYLSQFCSSAWINVRYDGAVILK